MKLNKYDDKLVRITCVDDSVYEGIAYYNSNEYDYHEFGVDEDSLQIVCFIFYKSHIKKVEILKEFSDKYGTLERETMEDGIDLIDEVLCSEEDIHVIRLLLYMKDYLDKYNIDKEKLNKLFEMLIKYNDNDEIKSLASELIRR